ncbi:MAG: CsiV family protein [Gammaproteobacteria bacterium]
MPELARTWRTIIGLIALSIAAGAQAQETALPRFQIELVVFEHLSLPSTPEAPVISPIEIPPPVIEGPFPLPGAEEPGADSSRLSPAQTEEIDADQPDPIFFALAAELGMSNIAASLQRDSAYRVLLHDAWIQDGYEGDATRAVDIGLLEQMAPVASDSRRNAASEGAMLSGSVTFYRGRYLHLDLDLSLGEGAGRLLQERRRVRIGEAGYFDAPKLGVIAMVTRVNETAETDIANDAASSSGTSTNEPAAN